MEKCDAVVIFGDDFGDNSTTFHCQLEKGHTGNHKEKGTMYKDHDYFLEWVGSMSEEEAEVGLDR